MSSSDFNYTFTAIPAANYLIHLDQHPIQKKPFQHLVYEILPNT